MTVKDLMKVCVIPDEKIKVWDNDEAEVLTRADIMIRSELLNREIEYLYNSPAIECICIILLNQ